MLFSDTIFFLYKRNKQSDRRRGQPGIENCIEMFPIFLLDLLFYGKHVIFTEEYAF